MGLDCGEESIATFSSVIERAATIVWNGPVGVFEFEKFAVGSKTVLENIVIATEKGATSIIGNYSYITLCCVESRLHFFAQGAETLQRVPRSTAWRTKSVM